MTDLKEDCPIISYSLVKVIDNHFNKLISMADYSDLFALDS